MSRKHVHDRIDRLEKRVAAAEAEVAALRAWRDSHVCFPQVYQPVPIPPAQPLPFPGQIWVGDVPPYGGYTTTVTIPSGGIWMGTNVCSGAAGAASTFTVNQPAQLRQVWPPKTPLDEPDMGVPALA